MYNQSLPDRFFQQVENCIKFARTPSPTRSTIIKVIYSLCFTLLFLLIIFNQIQKAWFLATPSRIMDDFRHAHWLQHDVGLHTPHGPSNIGYDVISPQQNQDFPLINIHLDPIKPTFPSGYHFITDSGYDPITSEVSEIDYKHRYLLPTSPIDIELPLHNDSIWNPAPIALPYNPLGYRYLMTRPIVRAKILDEVKSDTGWTYQSYAQLTCFSDWFPYDLIQEQDDEHFEMLMDLDKKSPGQMAFKNTRQYGLAHPDWVLDRIQAIKENRKPSRPILKDFDRDPLLQVVINTTRINKDKLAKYYGYDIYESMPFHPRIPTKTTNTTWTHRCITPWREDDGDILKPRHYRTSVQGPQHSRTTYDRCGRLLIQYSASNDYGPFFPEYGMRTVEARVFEKDEMLFRPLSDLCPIRHTYQHPIHLLGGGVEGHQNQITADWALLSYGQSPSDMEEMLRLKLEFTKAASLYDYRTNSLLLTHKNYLSLLSKFAPTLPPLLPPWRQLPPPSTKNDIKVNKPVTPGDPPPDTPPESTEDPSTNDEDDATVPTSPPQSPPSTPPPTSSTIERKNPSSTVTYLRRPSTYITKLTPLSLLSGPVEKFEKVRDNNFIFRQCLHSFYDFRHEFGLKFPAQEVHLRTNLLLLYISPGDWANDPFAISTPVSKQTPWVYFGLGTDKLDDYVGRTFMMMFNAETTELIAVRPFTTVLPEKCMEKEYDSSCRYGQGLNCNEKCSFIQLHHLFAVQTPLSYSLMTNNSIPTTPPKTKYPNFNPKSYDRLYANDININYSQSSNSFFESIVFDQTPKVDPKPLIPDIIPPSSIPNFINTKPPVNPRDTNPQRNTPISLSSNLIQQGLHFTLPTYYTLDSQFFAVESADDRQSFLQELDLRAFWRQRHPCNIELDAKTYPSSIPQKKRRRIKSVEKEIPNRKWSPPKQQLEVKDWTKIDPQPIRNTPYGLSQQFDIPHLDEGSNWRRYANIDEYPKRAEYVYEHHIRPYIITIIIFLIILTGFIYFCSEPQPLIPYQSLSTRLSSADSSESHQDSGDVSDF